MLAQRPVPAAGEGAAGKAGCPGACLLGRYRGATAAGRGAHGGDQASCKQRQEGGQQKNGATCES